MNGTLVNDGINLRRQKWVRNSIAVFDKSNPK